MPSIMQSLRISTLMLLLSTACRAFAPPALKSRLSSSRLFSTAATRAGTSTDVAVLGGGFGGLYTALDLGRRGRRVTLVDPSSSFCFLPLLYDLAVGTALESEVCPSYSSMLRGTGVTHVRGEFQNLSDANTVVLTDGTTIRCNACVVAVGASPASILAKIPGSEHVQPFYCQEDAHKTQILLNKLEKRDAPKVAVVGGGYGGVELSACLQRRLPNGKVSLLSRGKPLQGTRAESWATNALTSLGVSLVEGSAEKIELDEESSVDGEPKYKVKTEDFDLTFDAVLWTAGAKPSSPVPDGLDLLPKSDKGALQVDAMLRCAGYSNIFALGDCAAVEGVPKTAQAAMQQADIVASNVDAQLNYRPDLMKEFRFSDLGSMMTLGGPNGAILAPSGPLESIFKPALDVANSVLKVADTIVSRIPVDTLGLSFSSHGLGFSSDGGTWAGTLSGAARRAVYAIRMPTNEQRAVSAFSAGISTAASLAREANEKRKEKK